VTVTERETIPRTVDAVAEHVFETVVASGETMAMALGHRLGWYAALAGGEPTTAAQLAEATGTHERYCREWLEQQAASGMLDVAAPSSDTDRRFVLPPPVAEVMTNADSLAYLAPLARMFATAARDYELVAAAARTGGGVSWEAHGADMRESQADANRPAFLTLMADWLSSMPDVVERLRAPGARIADVGSGYGWSSVAMARAFPGARVDCFEVDAESVVAARAIAEDEGVADRVTVSEVDIAAALPEQRYALVTAFECIHDMPDPVGVLTAMREMAGNDGTVLVMDERTADELTAPAEIYERFLYGVSLFVCLPDGLSTPGSVGTGTVMRAPVLRGYAQAAGFSDIEVLDVDNDFFRFYRLLR